MFKKTLGNKIYLGDYVVTPIQQISIENTQLPHSVFLNVEFSAIGVIIEYDSHVYAMDLGGNRLSPDELLKD